mmetsp:Transcript_9092/g.21630  ORF Transcript_9092/g.21630 Transcript_9092/m.21630 type:complete len:282 (+) Transcript_9092:69-914(+)
MTDQSENERPSVQITLGFNAEREDDHILLSDVLAFVATSEDLARTRQVCRAFRKWSDEVASAQTTALIGGSVKPMIGQSIIGLLHAAEAADDRTRRALKEWNPDIRNEGFDIGLPTNKEENQSWHILAQVPCDPMAPGANVPVTLQLDSKIVEDNDIRGTLSRLPKGFFHMNANPSGWFIPCDRALEIPSERNLNDTLRRIKRDLLREHTSCPHGPAYALYCPARFDDVEYENLPRYKEYVALCMNVYSGYKLGQPIPKLDLFQKLVETKEELIEWEEENL